MAIPFTQYLRPRGEKRAEEIERPAEIEEMAQRFIAWGGRYECEVLTTGHASLTAVAEVAGEEMDVCIVLCRNGPMVPEKVDELVRKSVVFMEENPK
jgi:hypothetical protein